MALRAIWHFTDWVVEARMVFTEGHIQCWLGPNSV